MRSIDLSFVGTLGPDMQREISMLCEVGKTLTGFEGSLNLEYLIQTDPSQSLPSLIEKFVKGAPSERSLAEYLQNVKLALFFDRTCRDIADLPALAADQGCFVLMDEALASKTRKLTPQTHLVFKDAAQLIDGICRSFDDPLRDLFISVDLANRGLLSAAYAKFKEVPSTFAGFKGSREFCELLEYRMKGAS